MKTFDYVIQDSNGIHARPAGLLVKECAKFKSNITIETNGKAASANKLFAIMGLCVKQNDKIHVVIEGEDENEAAKSIEAFIRASV